MSRKIRLLLLWTVISSSHLCLGLWESTNLADFRHDQLCHPSGKKAPQDDFPKKDSRCCEHPYARSRASLPVENPTKSFWIDTPGSNPRAEEGSSGTLTKDADVCIIGSGITGVSTAWHLSRFLSGHSSESKAKIVIFEARKFCSGATGRNGGHLSPAVFSNFVDRQAKYNTSEAVKSYLLERHTATSLLQFISERNLENAVDLVDGGHITILRTTEEEAKAKEDFEAAKAAGLDTGGVRWIGNEEMIKKYGLDPNGNHTGVYISAHNLWPCKLVNHLHEAARSNSDHVEITLHTKTPVTSIIRHLPYENINDQYPISPEYSNVRPPSLLHTLRTPRGDVKCTYVVHATNAYTGHLLYFHSGTRELDMLKSSEYLSDTRTESRPSPNYPSVPRSVYSIVPTRGQVAAVRASVDPSELGWKNSWDVADDYWFPRYQDADNNTGKNPLIILGGGRGSAGQRMEAGVSDDSIVNPNVSRTLRNFLPSYFPGKFTAPDSGNQEGEWEMEWTGIMGFTESGDPFVGPVVSPSNGVDWDKVTHHQYDGHYISAGYTGHGMPRAYACAEVVAGMIAARINRTQWTSPPWLPEHYLTWATHG